MTQQPVVGGTVTFAVKEVTPKACCTGACWSSLAESGMAELASGWPPAPGGTRRSGPLSDTAPPRDGRTPWSVLTPPPLPSSSPLAPGSEAPSEAQPMVTPSLSGAPPPFDAQILPGAQPPFDAQSPCDSQPQFNGVSPWSFQAATSWCWGQSPEGFPRHQNLHNPLGKQPFHAGPPFTYLLPAPPSSFSLHSALRFWSLIINVLRCVRPQRLW